MGRLSAEHISDPNRRVKAETIMGEAEYANQKTRAIQARVKAMKAGTSVDKADTVETIKRVGEYKQARGQKIADYKPPIHGKRKK